MRTTVVVLLLAAAAASAKNVRFCCKTEFPETQLGDPFCGRQDLVFVGHRQEPRPWNRETLFEFLNGVATNLLFLVPLRMLHARRRTADTAACAGLIITSSAYHYCDVFRVKLLNMNAGNWHRLDNIFAIVTPVAVVPLLMGRARTPDHQRDIDFVRWSSLFIGLFFQELNPWSVTQRDFLQFLNLKSRRWRRRGAVPPRCPRRGRMRVHAPRECTETVSRRGRSTQERALHDHTGGVGLPLLRLVVL